MKKKKIIIHPDYYFYLKDAEDKKVAIVDLESKDGHLIDVPAAFDVWVEEMKPVIVAYELDVPYDKDWADYHRRGLEFAHQLRRQLADKYELWYEAPDEDDSGIIPTPIRIDEEPVKKIIFLDFDGVMVTEKYLEQLTADGCSKQDDYGSFFDSNCVKNLKEIIDSTDAEIVITSTWKMNLGLDGLQEMWNERDLPGKVVGITPDIDPIHRGDEIQAWLDAQTGAVRYAIIDDCPILDFFREDQLQHLFKVDEMVGLDEETVKKVIDHLFR